MIRRMLINARNPAEVRVAITSDGVLDDFKVDVAERGMTRGNIYFGLIANVQPSLNAAFIDYGVEKHGFLAIQDVVPDAYYKEAPSSRRPKIEDVLEKGRPIVVQVTREPEAQKGAALTTNLSLAGRYLVLTPFDKQRGVSRKVEDEETRKQLKDQVNKLDIPDGCGVILRTNALGQTKTALTRDLSALLRLWKRISTEARRSKKTTLLYSDQDLVLQMLRDYLDPSIGEVIVDEAGAFERAKEYMRAFMPRSRTKLIHYEERAPLLSRYHLEPQIEHIYQRTAPLGSGGSIVIDRTEALTAIDVNSGKSTGATSQEETAVHTNLEAAREVARQLRLRDIGGLVVVDFIDMRSRKNQRRVEKELHEAMKADKARSTTSRISANGLVEINRQRLQQAIQLRTQRVCPTCQGTGRVTSPEILSLQLLRTIHAQAADGTMARVRVSLNPEIADHFQNSCRRQLAELEEELDMRIEILSSPKLSRTEKELNWFAREKLQLRSTSKEATPPSASAASLQDAAKKKTRRRRSRRRGRGDGSVENAEQEKAATPNGASGSSASDAGPGDRRGSEERNPSTQPSREERGESQNGEAKAAADSSEGEPAPRRRRRRPRRRRRSSSSGDGVAASNGNGDGKAAEPGGDPGAAASETAGTSSPAPAGPAPAKPASESGDSERTA